MESKFKNLIPCMPAHNYAEPRNIYFHIVDSNIDDIENFYSKCVKNFFNNSNNAGWRRNNASDDIHDFFENFYAMYDEIKNFFTGSDILVEIGRKNWSVAKNFQKNHVFENNEKYFIFALSDSEEIDNNYKMFMFSFMLNKYPTIEYFEKTVNELHAIIEYQHQIIEDMNKAINDVSRKNEK